MSYTTGHCQNKKQPGGCQLHNVQCGYPSCDRKAVMETPKDPRNFPEDYQHENGCYTNLCAVCANEFIGYKRRRVCKVCLTKEETA